MTTFEAGLSIVMILGVFGGGFGCGGLCVMWWSTRPRGVVGADGVRRRLLPIFPTVTARSADPDFREVDSDMDLRVILRLARQCCELPYPTELTIEEREVSDVLDYIERGRSPYRSDIPPRKVLEERLRAGTALMYGIPLKVLPASRFGE